MVRRSGRNTTVQNAGAAGRIAFARVLPEGISVNRARDHAIYEIVYDGIRYVFNPNDLDREFAEAANDWDAGLPPDGFQHIDGPNVVRVMAVRRNQIGSRSLGECAAMAFACYNYFTTHPELTVYQRLRTLGEVAVTAETISDLLRELANM